jgi:hypothetical protein
MHPRLAVSATALIALLGCANHPDVGGTTQVGKVQAVFVEQYPGVFVDRRVADASALEQPAWAQLTFAHPLADGRTFATALLPADQEVEAGDVVQMRFRATANEGAEGTREHNRITALIAKRGTAGALRFDRPGERPLEWLSQAGN